MTESTLPPEMLADDEARVALAALVGTIAAHETRSEDCDRRGETYCDCLDRAVEQARAALGSSIPRGLAFHLETALTQARLAYRIALYEALDKQQEHLASVIEQLEEMELKLKAGERK